MGSQNIRRMLHETRFAPHFEFIGDFATHYGLFEGCGAELPFDNKDASGESCACC